MSWALKEEHKCKRGRSIPNKWNAFYFSTQILKWLQIDNLVLPCILSFASLSFPCLLEPLWKLKVFITEVNLVHSGALKKQSVQKHVTMLITRVYISSIPASPENLTENRSKHQVRKTYKIRPKQPITTGSNSSLYIPW